MEKSRPRPQTEQSEVQDLPDLEAVATPARVQTPGGCALCGESGGDANICDFCGAARSPGGFRTRRVVAHTAHSRLYEAVDPAGNKVALKELIFSRVPGAKEVDAFEREAKLLASLQHPQIPKVSRFFQEGRGANTRLYIAQEFVEGETLLAKLQSKRFDEADARTIAADLLKVLAVLHNRIPPLVHRDVKPANIIVRPDGTLALVDFGAARDLVRGETHGATFVGTYGYMPLEQYGGTVDPSADLYALGMTLVHLLSRKSPADLVSDEHRIDARKHVECSEAFEDWLAKLTAAKRHDRFRTAEEALAALGRPPVIQALPPGTKPATTTAVRAKVEERASAPIAPAETRQLLGTDARGNQSFRVGDLVVHEFRIREGGDEKLLQAHVDRIGILARAPLPGVAALQPARLEGPPENRRLVVTRAYVEGKSLEELLRDGVSERELIAIARTVLTAAAAVRARDPALNPGTFRPTKVVQRAPGDWVITDLDVAVDLPVAVVAPVADEQAASLKRTAASRASYFAPAEDRDSVTYSLGVTLLEALGKRRFGSRAAVDEAAAVHREFARKSRKATALDRFVAQLLDSEGKSGTSIISLLKALQAIAPAQGSVGDLSRFADGHVRVGDESADERVLSKALGVIFAGAWVAWVVKFSLPLVLGVVAISLAAMTAVVWKATRPK